MCRNDLGKKMSVFDHGENRKTIQSLVSRSRHGLEFMRENFITEDTGVMPSFP
jgi:hypothetical protein